MIKLLCGTIASGKSTYSSELAKKGWLVINDDAILNGLHAGHYTLYEEELKPLYKSIEEHVLHMAIAMGRNVIIDKGLNLSAKSRRRFVSIANSLDVEIEAICFPIWTAEEHAKLRMYSDDRGHGYDYWLKVAERHLSVWEQPTLEEGFAKIRFYEWKD